MEQVIESNSPSNNGVSITLIKTDGRMMQYKRETLVKSIMRETSSVSEIYGDNAEPLNVQRATEIALETEKLLSRFGSVPIRTSMVRELACWVMQKLNLPNHANLYSKVGASVYDIYSIDHDNGEESKENANLQPNPETFHKKKADLMSKDAYLRMLPNHLAKAHISGDMHIHDLEYFYTRPFCFDSDLRYFFYNGFMPDGTGRHTSVAKAAKHPDVAMLHACKVLGASQVCHAGGQGLFNFTTFMAPYLKGMTYDEMKQIAQMFIYEMTQLYVARGGQSVFASIQIESGVPKVWQDAPVVAYGKVFNDWRYGDLEDTVHNFANALLDVYIGGDSTRKMFNFPKAELVLRKRYFKEYEDTMLKGAELSAKFGGTYYDNNIPEYRRGEDGVACFQCCSYSFSEPSDTESFYNKINFVNGNHFSMGSMQVISINLPRIAYESKGDYGEFLRILDYKMDMAKEVLDIKRSIIKKQYDRGLIPFCSQRFGTQPPLQDIDSLTSTIGFVGLNECVEHITGDQLHESSSAQSCGIRTILEMSKKVKGYNDAIGVERYGIARTPAESTAQRFAYLDYKMFPEASAYVRGDLNGIENTISSNSAKIYYTNGSHVNVSANVPIYERMAIEEKYFPILKGGNIFHVWLPDMDIDIEALHKVNKAIANTQMGYWAHTRDLTRCNTCGNISYGINDTCMACNSKDISNYSRITGYYQDVSSWNAAKKQELKDRHKVAF